MKEGCFKDVEDFLEKCWKVIGEVEKSEASIKNNLAQCQEKLSRIEENSKKIIDIFNATQASSKWTERADILLEIDMCIDKLKIIEILKELKGTIKEKEYKQALKVVKLFKWPKEPNDLSQFLDTQEQKQKSNRKMLMRSFLNTFKDTNQFCGNLKTILELCKATKPYLNECREHYLAAYDELELIAELPTSEVKDVDKKLAAYSREYMRYERFLENFDKIIEKTIECELKLYWKFFESFHDYVDDISTHSPTHTVQFNVAKSLAALSNAQNAPEMGGEKRRVTFRGIKH